MSKITGQPDYSKINFKGFYLDSMKVSMTCPECSKKLNLSLSGVYPCDVEKDGTCTLYFSCSECEEPISLSKKLQISLK